MWDDGMWGGGMHGWGWVGLALLALVLVLVAAAAVVLAVSLGRSGSKGEPPPVGGQSEADRVLDERYARGEIDEQEYLHRRAVLRGR